VANQLEGKGGGRPDMAQGAGSRVVDLPKALNSVMEWVKAR
jgi:alanyl-tRNA synthetase